MKPQRNARPHGQLRQSQVITTFGPGSMIDLPTRSVIIGGLDTWLKSADEIHEPRLIEKIRRLLNLGQLRFYPPPANPDDPTAAKTGIHVYEFPSWFVTQDVEIGPRGGLTRSRMLVHRASLDGTRYIDDRKRKHPVVPVRFVRACRNGHIADLDWRFFAHRGATECRRKPLWMDERGTSGDLAEIVVRCDCGKERRLSDATITGQKVLGMCEGQRPWLGPVAWEGCDQPNRLLVRSASNAYFARVMSVISLPDKNESIEKAVNDVYSDNLAELESVDELRFMRKKIAQVKAALDGFTDDEIWAEIQSRKGATLGGQAKSVKQAEFEVLSSATEQAGIDITDTSFSARALAKEVWEKPWMGAVERVVLVHRLREVVAQVGFTRFEASSPDVEGELQMGVKSAPLAMDATWLPAVENRGEGVFIQFKKAAIDDWLKRPEVIDRGKRLYTGFEAWKAAHPQSGRLFPGLSYYLLHTVSHMLLTAVSLECGYPASSIRERVYSLEAGYGILLYTGSPDAEGTLGGLVETGRQIHRHLQAALELARLCSNDPVCAQHDPPAPHEGRFLHGAACHGCLLVAETSCEQQNDFLDRSLAVPTVEAVGAEFFTG